MYALAVNVYRVYMCRMFPKLPSFAENTDNLLTETVRLLEQSTSEWRPTIDTCYRGNLRPLVYVVNVYFLLVATVY